MNFLENLFLTQSFWQYWWKNPTFTLEVYYCCMLRPSRIIIVGRFIFERLPITCRDFLNEDFCDILNIIKKRSEDTFSSFLAVHRRRNGVSAIKLPEKNFNPIYSLAKRLFFGDLRYQILNPDLISHCNWTYFHKLPFQFYFACQMIMKETLTSPSWPMVVFSCYNLKLIQQCGGDVVNCEMSAY